MSEIEASAWTIGAFAGYLLLIVGIGILSARFSSRGIAEYFVGGRRMNRFVVALSAVSSGRSAWLLVGVTGIAWQRGVSAVWAIVGYTLVELLLFLFYGRRLRRFSETYDCITVPDFFASRLQEHKGWLRVVLGVVILVFMVSYVSSQFVAGGKAFAAAFDMEKLHGTLLTALIVLGYTALGGFLAASLTDTLQAVLMLVALVVVPTVAIVDRGGLAAVYAQLLTVTRAGVDPLAISAGGLVGFLAIGLGSPGNPHILARYMSIRDPDHLRWSAVAGTFWNVVMGWGAVWVGIVGRVVFPDAGSLPGGDKEQLYPALAQTYLHPALFGLVLASVFAAIMSTADSQLLVAASTLVRDVYEKVLARGRTIEQRTLVWMSRTVVVSLVALALGLGAVAQQLVFWLVLFAWAGLGAALGPTSILALYWKGTTRAGVVAGLVAGTATTFAWHTIGSLKDAVYELVPAFAAGLVATLLVSRMTRPPREAERMIEIMRGESRHPSVSKHAA